MRHRSRRAVLGLLALGPVALHARAATPPADEVVAGFIRNMLPGGATRFTVEVVNYAGDKEDRSANLSIHVGNIAKDRSSASTLIYFDGPVKAKGRIVLYENDRAWSYFPGTSRPIRIPLREQLFGDADIGSLLNIDYRTYFKPEVENVSAVDTRLTFVDDAGKAEYGKVVFVIDARTYQPLKADYYGASGVHLRTAVYGAPKDLGGKTRYSEVEISNPRRPGSRTVVRYLAAERYELPARNFRPELLREFART